MRGRMCCGMREQLAPDLSSLLLVCVRVHLFILCVCVCVGWGRGGSWHFILTVLKWQIKYTAWIPLLCRSLHAFDLSVFAVCQTTLRFSLSGSSQLWFGSVSQPQRLGWVCVFLWFFICHMVKTWLWLLIKQNSSCALPCRPPWSS